MGTMLNIRNWSGQQRLALTATQVVAGLAKLDGWRLHGEAAQVCVADTARIDNIT